MSDLGVLLPQPLSIRHERTTDHVDFEARSMLDEYDGWLITENGHLAHEMDYDAYDHYPDHWVDIWWSRDGGVTWTQGKARSSSVAGKYEGSLDPEVIFSLDGPYEMTDDDLPDDFWEWPEADRDAWLS